jgi:hypothetical protein
MSFGGDQGLFGSKDLPMKKRIPRMLNDPLNTFGFFGEEKEEPPLPPTAAMLAEAAQKERKRMGKKQGYLSTVLSMGSPLNDAGPKSLLGG